MKKYSLGLIAIIIAFIFCAFAFKKSAFPGSAFCIQLISTTQAKAENPGNYQQSPPIVKCGTPQIIACCIYALAKYTHSEGGVQVLNTPINPGGGAPYLTISATKSCPARWRISAIFASDFGLKGVDFDWENAPYSCPNEIAKNIF